jgi:uncharacterized protein YgbK (DUF1537 family)
VSWPSITWPDDPLPELARRAATRPAVVLDDDPTGTQTLRDVTVLTEWDSKTIDRHLDDPVVFLSTNSRSLEAPAAAMLAHQAVTAAVGAGRPISLVSRSDSTLRGHFVTETRAIAAAMGAPEARILLAPFFGEGGRVTVDDVHLLERDGVRTPVGETEFARDATFGFRSSNLREWVAEKYAAAGLLPPPMVSLSLAMLRGEGPDAVAEAIGSLAAGGVAIANAETERDIEVVALGALQVEEAGLALVARTAASYVRARAGRPPAPLLAADEVASGPAGLIVVGSYVPTTSRQLAALLESPAGARIAAYELSVEGILAGDQTTLVEMAASLDRTLAAGRIGLMATERVRRDVDLASGRRISQALVDVVRRLERRPDWIIAKGGITSSDIAANGLGMRESRVAGQLLPGVPVWIGGDESRWPGLPLVVFPGNVGGPRALTDAVGILERSQQPEA